MCSSRAASQGGRLAGAVEDAAVGVVPHGEPAVADDALLHHGDELAVVDAAVVVLVHLPDDVVDADVGHVVVPAGLLELVDGDVAAAVLVEVGEGGEEVLLALELAHVDGGGDELVVVDGAAAVDVGGVHEVADLALAQVGAVAAQPLPELLEGDGAAAVGVHGLEHLLEAGELLLGEVLRDDPQRHLLEAVHGGEVLEPGEDGGVEGAVGGDAVLADPGVLCPVGDGRPWVRLEVDGAPEDGVEDALLRVGPEGRHPAEEDVDDDPRRPHVRLGTVVLAQHLGRHVVGRPHHVGEHLAGLEEDGEAEVDGLERRRLLLLLLPVVPAEQQEVLGLEVPVHHPQRVARLDDADDDPRDLRRLALREVAPLHDAVEELAALAQLHDDVDVERVLVGALDGDDAGVAGEVVHDLDLAPHVVHVLRGQQLALGDGLAGQRRARADLRAQVRGPELPLPQLATQRVELAKRRRRVPKNGGGGRKVLLVPAAAHLRLLAACCAGPGLIPPPPATTGGGAAIAAR
nr:unnamed protein product [Digitaria exilis]